MNTKTLALAAALLACITPRSTLARPHEAPARWGPYSLEVVGEGGGALPTFEHGGRTYVLGALGQRYLLRVRNDSPRRIEVVASVDGLDVVDGRPAALEKRGYLVEPNGQVVIDGFRLSERAVAAFRFSSVPRSYAARQGNARDVGVIGVAVFPERAPRYEPYRRPYAPQYDERAPSANRSEVAPAPAPHGDVGGDAAAPGAPSREALRPDAEAQRPGLGTEFGEEHGSPVYQVQFEREGPRPAAVLTLRYDDRPGLLAAGIDVDRYRWSSDDAWQRETADPFRRDASFSQPPPGWRAAP